MTWLDFVILTLATWRLAHMLVEEPGPFHVFTRIRKSVGIEHDADEKPLIIPRRFMAGILSCVWCCSMWVGIGWTTLWMLAPLPAKMTALIFALSAAAIWIEERMGRG